ncbi:MAG TPA: LysR family transcriptional regulator [Xanthobacteraceae bacterium]|nr:LysR family transcriptional regulator [Xanthobacteraceae bacterium]
MPLTLQQLRTFERIARLGSFRSAADHLGLTQPSVSQRIRELENELGTQLFVRRGPQLSLTVEGHTLIEYADRMLDTAGEIVDRFRSRDPLKGTLRLGLSESFALICLTDLLKRLEGRYPDLKASVHVGDTGAVSALLNERKLDIAVVSEPVVEPHVHARPIGTNQLGWVASARFDIAQTVLSPQDLARHHLIISPPTARLHLTATSWFAQGGATPTRVSTCNSLSVTVLSILEGLGIGLVPIRVMQEEIARGKARQIPTAPQVPGHRVSLCYQASEFGPSLTSVLDIIRELIVQHRLFV